MTLIDPAGVRSTESHAMCRRAALAQMGQLNGSTKHIGNWGKLESGPEHHPASTNLAQTKKKRMVEQALYIYIMS